MIRNKKWLQVAILVLLLIVGGYTIVNGLFASDEKPPQEGDRAPNFSLSGLEGEIIRLSDFKGKTVMINFWGTFCEPCVEEMPLIQQYYDRLKDQDFVVLGINLDEPLITARSFVEEYNLTFPIALDKNVVRKQYGVNRYPTTFFVDADGVIYKKFVGQMQAEHIDDILSGMSVLN